jgi:outer membrane PBP1 activator LpoA protein
VKKEESLQEPSNIRSLLIKAQIALNENRFEEALDLISNIKTEELATLTLKELQAIANLVNYIQTTAEEKKSFLLNQLKVIQASKEYL